MHSPGINGEGELRRQPANPGSPGKMSIKMECVYCMGPNFDIKLSSDELIGFKQSFKSSFIFFIPFKILFRTHI